MIYYFYHSSDLDGHCSAAIANKYFLDNKVKDVEFIPYKYGDETNSWLEKIKENDTVYFSDVVLSPYDKMKELCAITKNVIVIDHHKTFIEYFNENKLNLKISYLDSNYSGCELTYKYFFECEYNCVPTFVKLLGRYDIWDSTDKVEWENKIFPFQYRIRAEETLDPNSYIWRRLFDDGCYSDIEELVQEGESIIKYQKQNDKKACKDFSFETEFESYRAIAMNSNRFTSNAFDSVYDPKKYDLMICFNMYPTGKFNVSFYSTTIDVSAIAKKYGGGGHVGAAGCVVSSVELNNNILKLGW
jgi:oligoribonuclease NrnB/cAMP/cGMP phosphodiesterase (DHH superfamily)